jgi:hypothetical protein
MVDSLSDKISSVKLESKTEKKILQKRRKNCGECSGSESD